MTEETIAIILTNIAARTPEAIAEVLADQTSAGAPWLTDLL